MEMEEYKKAIDCTFNQIKINISDRNDALKINHYEAISEVINDEIVRLQGMELNGEIYKRLFNFNKRFQKILIETIELHIQIEKYYNPVIVGSVLVKDFKAAKFNNFLKLTATLPKLIEFQKYISVYIKRLQVDNQVNESIFIKNYCINNMEGYLLLLENLGINIKISPLYRLFDDLKENIENSVDIEELKFIAEKDQVSTFLNTNLKTVNNSLDKYVNMLFDGDSNKLDLFKYLSENFASTDSRVNDLTKYNHIYRYFNEGRDYNLEQRAYKDLVKELFNFDYAEREIKGQTQKHLQQLERLANHFKK